MAFVKRTEKRERGKSILTIGSGAGGDAISVSVASPLECGAAAGKNEKPFVEVR